MCAVCGEGKWYGYVVRCGKLLVVRCGKLHVVSVLCGSVYVKVWEVECASVDWERV